MENDYKILRQCEFFEGIPEEKYPNVLNCLNAVRKKYTKNTVIRRIGDPAPMAGVVLSGMVEMVYGDEQGNQININHLRPGKVFGAALAYMDEQVSPVQLKALTDCDILFLDFKALKDMDAKVPYCPHRARVTSNLLHHMAQQTKFLNQRLQLMSQKRLRDKIKLYLQQQKYDTNGRVILPFTRNEMADYLYVDRSALSRELGRMQQEDLIAFEGQEFWILDKEYFEIE